jgi:hypothetical protein|nr:MAG TPA: hypothetical protein [Caudoviricetes sp.]
MEDGKIFFPSLFKALKGVDDATFREAVCAVTDYAFYGTEPSNLSLLSNAVFTLMRPTIDNNNSRREAGKRGAESRWAKQNEKADAKLEVEEVADCEEMAKNGKTEEPSLAMIAENGKTEVPSLAMMAKNGKTEEPSLAIAKADGTDTETDTETDTDTETETGAETGTEKSVARDAHTPAHETAAAPSRSKEPKEPKHKHGEYGHVRLTDAEFVRLKTKHGEAETEAAIRVVDEYVETSGRPPYKNYALALEKWGYQAAREQRARELRDADGRSAPVCRDAHSRQGPGSSSTATARASSSGFTDYLLRVANGEEVGA